jgi:hypothetical protein
MNGCAAEDSTRLAAQEHWSRPSVGTLGEVDRLDEVEPAAPPVLLERAVLAIPVARRDPRVYAPPPSGVATLPSSGARNPNPRSGSNQRTVPCGTWSSKSGGGCCLQSR